MRKALALVLCGAMAVSMVGCGSSNSGKKTSDETSKKSVKLSVTTTYAGEDTNAQNYKDAVAAWESKTGNKVDDSSATSDETFKSRITTDFETGSEPDVLFFFNGVDSNQFVEQGKVVSVDEIRKEYPDYASNMKDDMLGASPVDGKNYSIPVNGFWEGMFVNKEVLKKAGVDVPTKDTTWDEFLQMCEKIKKAGYTPIAASLLEIPHYWFEYSIYNFDSPTTHNTVPAKVDDAAGKAWVSGLEDIKTLYEKGYFPANTLTAKDDETFQLFTNDKAAFLCDGSWKVGGIESAVKDPENYTVTYVPGKGDRKSTDIIGGISMGYYITKKAWDDPEKRAAAVDFVEYMTSDEMVSKFAGTGVTALKNGTTPADNMTALSKDAVTFSAGVTAISPAVQDNLSEAVRKPIFGEMSSIVQGKTAVKDAVQAVIDKLGE
ncbi:MULTISPECIES: ABC transporter substrate-binding protein [Eubacterium]|uniref:ABC transporter substrate-binding protein n=2 Tax=Eubacteriaceae TaxID=186806 RepID=UPI0018F78E87|nr:MULTISPECIES: extracellular solute-binding protein [unclassified Eubacterium (in: firmicutes)]